MNPNQPSPHQALQQSGEASGSSPKKMKPDREVLFKLQEADEAGQVAYTRHLCERILAEFPDHGPTLIRYASTLITFALYDKAASVLDHAERVVPRKRRHLVLAQRGHRLARMGDFAGAEKEHLKAHELDPNDAGYLIYAGTAAFRSGHISRAEELARRSVACSEGCLDEAYFNLGGYLLAQRRYIESRDCYLKALEIDPDYSIAQARLADLDRIIQTLGDSNPRD